MLYYRLTMKKTLISLAALTLFAACATAQPKPVNPNATPEAHELLVFIYNQKGKGVLTGQHSYPLFSDIYMERVENLTDGSHPVVFGQDFGYSKPGSLDGINFRQRSIDNAVKWHKRGAIITFMWHAVPPTTESNFTTWKGDNAIQSDLTDQQWNDLFTEGTEINNRWKAQVDAVAFFLRQLQDEKIPVIWRPYHEMNGDWFWWGSRPADYVKLYRMLYDRITNFHKINNLLWVFNGNELGSPNVQDYEPFFPGRDYIDILATDIYNHGYNKRDYDTLLKLANGKPIAWGEVGPLPTDKIIEEQPEWAWFMCWCEFLEVKNDYQARMNIYNSDKTITLEELNKK